MSAEHLAAGFPTGIVETGARLVPACAVAFLEGPACSADGTVYFSDIANDRIVKFDPRSRKQSVFRAPSHRANGLLFDRQGRLLICEGNEWGNADGGRRVSRMDLATGQIELLADRFEGARLNAPNDIAARSNGQIFFTDPCYSFRETMELTHDSVYRLDIAGRLSRILTQPLIQRPNGIALSPDEQTLYLVDSCPIIGGHRKIWAFDLNDAGDPLNPRVLHDFAPGRGGDGMAVDVEGNLYIAAGIARPRGPHETTDAPAGIYILSRDGRLNGRIPIPEDVLTNVTFGGDDLRTLYVTAGKTLFEIRTEIPGWLVHRPI